MKSEPAFRKVHAVADRIEPRLARALVIAAKRLRSRFPIAHLTNAVAAGDVHLGQDQIAHADVEDSLQPSAQILRDAFIQGGKVAADELP